MRRLLFETVLLAQALTLSACSSSPGSSSRVEVFDSAGVRIVMSLGPSWGDSESWTVAPEPGLVIGVFEGPEEYQLVDVEDAARRSDGSVVIVDGGAKTVRLYDAEGIHIKTLGTSGSGPGEFTNPGPLVITEGDSIVVWDQALLRATHFGPDGELARVRSLDWGTLAARVDMGDLSALGTKGGKAAAGSWGLFPGPMEPIDGGAFLVRLVEKSGGVPVAGSSRTRSGLLRVSEDLTEIDTVGFFRDVEQVTVEAPWGPFSVEPPVGRRTRIADGGTPTRTCIGEQEEAEVLCILPDGSATSVRWTPKALPVLESEVSDWREAIVASLGLKLSRDQVLEVLDGVPVPEARPPYSDIVLDRAGNLWVELGPSPGSASASPRFLVFDSRGILLGSIDLPGLDVLEIGEDYVLGVQRDEFGIQSVRLHALSKAFSPTD